MHAHRYRPTYTDELMEAVISFCDKHSVQYDTVVDVGCGSGQSTFQWCPYFKECIGIDISENQIRAANDKLSERPSIQNLEFRVGPAENLPLPDKSVDMLSFGTCWHWLKLDKVIPEIQRVLKKPGCVAIYTFLPYQFSCSKCNNIYQSFYENCMKEFVPSVYLSEYRDSPYPYPLAEECNFSMSIKYTLTDFYHLNESISAYAQYKKQNPDSQALTEMVNNLDQILPEHDKTIVGSFPMKLLLFKA